MSRNIYKTAGAFSLGSLPSAARTIVAIIVALLVASVVWWIAGFFLSLVAWMFRIALTIAIVAFVVRQMSKR
jgi:hypothetical protein